MVETDYAFHKAFKCVSLREKISKYLSRFTFCFVFCCLIVLYFGEKVCKCFCHDVKIFFSAKRQFNINFFKKKNRNKNGDAMFRCDAVVRYICLCLLFVYACEQSAFTYIYLLRFFLFITFR